MREADRLGQILVQPQRARDRAADLRHLQAVGEPDAEMIAVGREEHLRLVAQPPERDRVDDAIAVALVIIARTTRRAGRFAMQSPAPCRRIGRPGRGRSGHLPSILFIFWPALLVKVKADTPSFASLLTIARASASVLNGPVTTRLVARSFVV